MSRQIKTKKNRKPVVSSKNWISEYVKPLIKRLFIDISAELLLKAIKVILEAFFFN